MLTDEQMGEAVAEIVEALEDDCWFTLALQVRDVVDDLRARLDERDATLAAVRERVVTLGEETTPAGSMADAAVNDVVVDILDRVLLAPPAPHPDTVRLAAVTAAIDEWVAAQIALDNLRAMTAAARA